MLQNHVLMASVLHCALSYELDLQRSQSVMRNEQFLTWLCGLCLLITRFHGLFLQASFLLCVPHNEGVKTLHITAAKDLAMCFFQKHLPYDELHFS